MSVRNEPLSCVVVLDDDLWRSFSTKRFLRHLDGVMARVILASRWIHAMKWIGSDSADILLVRDDTLRRVAPSLIEDLRWHESAHGHRRHPVLLLTDELQQEERPKFDGVLHLTGDAYVIASELNYWLANSTSIRWLPTGDVRHI